MASANLDLMRSIYAAWECGDYGSAAWADPEIEFVSADGPSPGRWVGLAEMAGVSRDYLSAWEEFRQEAEEYRESDGHSVLVLIRRSGRGKRSGVEVAQRGAHVFHIDDGKVTRFVQYWERQRALADLGLTPDTGT